ncbi:MAG: hypothetical protein AAF657_32630 [Acidobacteriota bacterium]
MEKRWTNAEVSDLKARATKHTADELARRFKTDADQIRDKLKELGLEAATASSGHDEDALNDFSRALELLHDKKWSEAAELLEKLVADSPGVQLADRARQHLAICQRQMDSGNKTEDAYLQAVFEKNRGNLEAASALCAEHGSVDKEERFAYLMASISALDGAEDEALEHLETAIRLEPKNRVHAFHDPDFQALRGRDEFSQLIQAP